MLKLWSSILNSVEWIQFSSFSVQYEDNFNIAITGDKTDKYNGNKNGYEECSFSNTCLISCSHQA